jgi:predicted O-methyltransferase YrrM
VESLRLDLLRDHTELEVEDLGAGSTKSTHRKISVIVSKTAKNRKYARLLFRIANLFPHSNIIELGTSLGISAAYLASANKSATLHTIEGAPAIANKARENFEKLGLSNIHSYTGNFDDLLPSVLEKASPISIAFIDGNHLKDPTIRYFRQLSQHIKEDSILIFDDIHWSKGMEEAWKEIKSSKIVTLSIDLFFLGLIFFRKDFKVKQDFTIRY